ncbi:MAG: L-seryl-tRNA(Sec) selenium transferase, partial [Caldilineae bacterium]
MQEFRKLPAVDALLKTEPIARLAADHGRELVVEVLRELLDDARDAIRRGGTAPAETVWPQRLAERLGQRLHPSLRPVINATGVIIHTNLGRAPLSQAAREAVARLAAGYNTLEYDLEAGQRGSRYAHSKALLCELTGAEDALIVNNNAAAVFLVLAGLCQGREVLISRGQLVEIGGGFRIPDVLRQSGARLVEVGATNRTHLRDFEDA